MYIKNIICGFSAALLLAGCSESFLDTDNLTTKDSSNFPANKTDADQIVTGMYAPLMGDGEDAMQNSLFIAELMSDERFGSGGKDDPPAQSIASWSKTSEDQYNGLWCRMYQGIYRANYLMQTINQIDLEGDEELKNRYLGEAHFMRAFYYYELVRWFDRVPLLLAPEAGNPPQAEPAETYGQIASDYLKAIELLPATPHTFAGPNTVGTDGHASRWAAEALLARAFLMYTGYYGKESITLPGEEGELTKDKVVALLDDCINNSGHDLASKFGDLWNYSAAGDYWLNAQEGYCWLGDNPGWTGWKGQTAGYRDNPEFMFVGKHAYGQDKSDGNNMNRNVSSLFFSLRYQDDYNDNTDGDGYAGVYPFGSGWGCGTVTRDIYETWPANDPRRVASILNVDDPAEGMTYHENGFHHVEDTHLFNKKYININITADGMEPYDLPNTIPNGVPLYSFCSPEIYAAKRDYQSANYQDDVYMRFADVLLMHSELTGTATGMNRVRARVGLDPVAYSLENIMNERRWELAFEGIRFFDLKRWHKFDIIDSHRTNVQAMCDGERKLVSVRIRPETNGFLPIPQRQINLSEGMLTQNPGWATSEGNFKSQY